MRHMRTIGVYTAQLMQLRIKLCRIRNYLGARDNCVCSIVGASGAAVAWKLSDEQCSLRCFQSEMMGKYLIISLTILNHLYRNYDIELITPTGSFDLIMPEGTIRYHRIL